MQFLFKMIGMAILAFCLFLPSLMFAEESSDQCDELTRVFHDDFPLLVAQCYSDEDSADRDVACTALNDVSFYFPEAWKSCEQDSDCQSVLSWCGESEAVNSGHAKALIQTVQCLDAGFVECEHLKESEPYMTDQSYCNELKQCVLGQRKAG